jgi:sensor histidine kinase YesM
MDFVNKGFSSIIIMALVFFGAVVLINILPILLIGAAGIWGISWIVRKVRKMMLRKNMFSNKAEDIEINTDYNTEEKTIIDVEYTEL